MKRPLAATRWADVWWNEQLNKLKRRAAWLFAVEIILLGVVTSLWLDQRSRIIPWPTPWLIIWLSTVVAALLIAVILLRSRGRQPPAAPGWLWRSLWHMTHILHSVSWGIGFLFLAPEDPQTANALLVVLTVLGGYTFIPVPLTFTIFQLGLLLPPTLAISLGFLPADTSIFLLPILALIVSLIIGILSFCHSLWDHCDSLHMQIRESLDDREHWGEEKEGMEKTISTLQELSMHDSLTGLSNRRHFDQTYAREWRRARRLKTPLSLLMIDIDHFKQYNDKYGHMQGDTCLRRVSKEFERYTRRGGDMAARYGGEEFVILLPDTPVDNALQMADRIRRGISDLGMAHTRSRHGIVTVTIGVAGAQPNDGQKAKDVMRRADDALYDGKYRGRNCVATAPEPDDTATTPPLTSKPKDPDPTEI